MTTSVTSSMVDTVYQEKYQTDLAGFTADLHDRTGVLFAFHSITAPGAVLMLVYAGGMVFGASLAGRVADLFAGGARPPAVAFPELSDREREREVLDLLAAGRSNDAVAGELYLSSKTVRHAVSSIYAKLHAAGRVEAIITAREAGFGRGWGSGPGLGWARARPGARIRGWDHVRPRLACRPNSGPASRCLTAARTPIRRAHCSSCARPGRGPRGQPREVHPVPRYAVAPGGSRVDGRRDEHRPEVRTCPKKKV